MTKEEFAKLLHGRDYLDEISDAEEAQARDAGLVVVFGYSDDNIEFRGALNLELPCVCSSKELHVHRGGVLPAEHNCSCQWCGFEVARGKCQTIQAIWCGKNGYSWEFETSIPHATFDINASHFPTRTGKFCRGIVFNIQDLPQL